jgi:hypothetical protein
MASTLTSNRMILSKICLNSADPAKFTGHDANDPVNHFSVTFGKPGLADSVLTPQMTGHNLRNKLEEVLKNGVN